MNDLPITVRYAIRILIFLALSPGHPVSANSVARIIRIPPSQAAKVLHVLRWGGLTRSRRGAHGGYELQQDPEEIRVEQVLKLFLLPAEEEGTAVADDPFQRIWTQTKEQAHQELLQMSIVELSRRMPIPLGKQGMQAATRRL